MTCILTMPGYCWKSPSAARNSSTAKSDISEVDLYIWVVSCDEMSCRRGVAEWNCLYYMAFDLHIFITSNCVVVGHVAQYYVNT